MFSVYFVFVGALGCLVICGRDNRSGGKVVCICSSVMDVVIACTVRVLS